MVTISTHDLSVWHHITYDGVRRSVFCDARDRDVVYIEAYYDGELLEQAMMKTSAGSVGAVEGGDSNKGCL